MSCDQFLSECHSSCCRGPIPMTQEFLDTHTPVRPVAGVLPHRDGNIAPYAIDQAGSGRLCPFLGLDGRCTVYEDRPQVCRTFGDESTLFMTCPYEDREGRARTREERRRIDNQVGDALANAMKRMPPGRPPFGG